MDELGSELSLKDDNVDYIKQNGVNVDNKNNQYLLFDIQNPSGEYEFEIKLKNGKIYKATLSWVKPVLVSGITISPKSLELEIGDEEQVEANVIPSNADDLTYKYESSNSSIATVNSNGIVTGISEGSTTIVVKSNDGGFTDQCNVVVKRPIIDVEGISISPKSIELSIGDTDTLSYTITPSNADNKNATYSSSNDEVATVSQDGEVTAIEVGEANITVTSQDGNFTDVCSVSVVE